MRLIDRMRPSAVTRSHAVKQRSFIRSQINWPCGQSWESRSYIFENWNWRDIFSALSSLLRMMRRMHGHLEETLRRHTFGLKVPIDMKNKINIYFLKSAVRNSQGSVRAPHGLGNRRASDAQSINVLDHRLICKHVRKPLYGPRTLILVCTSRPVQLRPTPWGHPHGDVAANKPHGGRMPYVVRALTH